MKSIPFASLRPDQVAPDKVTHSSGGTAGSTSLPAGEAYSHLLENPFIDGHGARLRLFGRRGYRVLFQHPPIPHSRQASPQGCRADRGDAKLFPRPLSRLGGDVPLAMQVEIGGAWRPEHRLARVCVQALELSPEARPSVNLVFAVDVSPSMRSEKPNSHC